MPRRLPAGLALTACVLAAPAVLAQRAGGSLTITPQAHLAFLGEFYDGRLLMYGQRIGSLGVAMDDHVATGGEISIRLGRSPWSLFGDFSRGSADASLSLCLGGENYDAGCDQTTVNSSFWQTTVGGARRLGSASSRGPSASVRFGVAVGRLAFDGSTDDSGRYDSMGLLAGFSAIVPMSTRVALRGGVTLTELKMDTNALARDVTVTIPNGPALPPVELESRWLLIQRASIGLALCF